MAAPVLPELKESKKMAGLIPENLLEDILSRVDIVELISSYIPLKKAGHNFRSNCPFHHEKTPSFMVSPQRQIYHCFGCGESGNAFKFLMRHERMEFPEAVKTLAEKTGVILPELDKPGALQAASLSSQIYKINALALTFYENNLQAESAGIWRDYLTQRGIKPETIKEQRLGLATSSWEALTIFLRTQGFSLPLLEKAGLVLAKDAGGYFDRFRNRLIFPIFDVRNRVIGFGARVRDNTLPKYLNSPETPVYTKGKNLFGLNLAKEAIGEMDEVIIVEGYLDFMLPFQEGLRNIVASQGTALTLEQIRLLKRYTHNITMIYDGDCAGEMATLRSLDLLIEEGMLVKIVPLPKGVDPDLFVRQNGMAALKDKVAQAVNLFDYKLNVLKTRYSLTEVHGKSKIAAQMLLTINKFENAITRGEYVKKLAEAIKVPERDILEELHKLKPLGNEANVETGPLAKKSTGINPAEKLLIKFMLEEKDLIEKIMQQLVPSDFQDLRTVKIVSVMQELVAQGKNIAPSILMNYFSEDDASQLVCESMFMPMLSDQEREKAVKDCIQRIKVQRLRSQRESLHVQIKTAQLANDEPRLSKLTQEFHNLIKKGD